MVLCKIMGEKRQNHENRCSIKAAMYMKSSEMNLFFIDFSSFEKRVKILELRGSVLLNLFSRFSKVLQCGNLHLPAAIPGQT